MPIIGAETIVNSVTSNNQTTPAVAVLTGGRYVVTWASADAGDGSGSLIRARVFNADGTAVGSDFQVNSTGNGNQLTPCITALANGGFVVSWYSEDTLDGSIASVRARVFDANSNPAGSDFRVNSTFGVFETNPSIALLSDGRFAIVWQSNTTGDGDGNCIRGRLFHANGTPATSDLAFGTTNDFIINSTGTLNQSDPSIIGLSNGNFFVTWGSQDTGDGSASCIRGRLFNSTGFPQGNDVVIDTSVSGDQTNPSLTALADGGFLVTWHSGDGGDGSSHVIRARKFTAFGVAAGNDIVTNSTHVDSQINVSATALPGGGYVLTWQSSDGGDGSGTAIRARIFDSFGDPVGSDFVVNSTGDGSQSSPSIATLANGNVVLTWQSGDSGDGSGTTIRTITLDTGQVGSSLTGTNSAESVTGTPFNDRIIGLDGDDFIYAGAGRNVVHGGGSYDTLVLSGASSDFRVQHLINDAYAIHDLRLHGPQGMTFVQDLELLAFSDSSGAIGTYAATPWPHGLGNDFLTNTTFTSEQLEPAVGALGNGRFIVLWSSDDGNGAGYYVRGRIFDADGIGQGNDFLIPSTHAVSGGNNQYDPVVASLQNGNFVAAWWSDDGGDGSGAMIRARLFNSSGTALANDFQVNSIAAGNQLYPEITVLSDGHFVVTWYSDDAVGGDGDSYSIRARVFNPDGSAVGSDFLVNFTTTSYQWQPDVSALSGGQFVAVWQSNDGGDGSGDMIRGRIFTSTGAPVTASDFAVNSTASGDQSYPGVTTLTNGNFVVTWYSDDNTFPGDISGTGIRARIFNSDGTPVANDFIVNNTTSGSQSFSRVTALPNGQFFVTWQSGDGGDGNGGCIRGRFFNANGTAAGNDFIINTTTANSQERPSVAVIDSHHFVVSWDSYDGDFNRREIHSRMFSFNSDPGSSMDSLSVLENGTLNSNLITGTSGATADTDADHDTLAVYTFSDASRTNTFWLPGTSIQGDYGTFTLSSSGNLQYAANRPAAEALGAGQVLYEYFTYGVTDDLGGASSPLTYVYVYVTGVNDAPAADLNGAAAGSGATLNYLAGETMAITPSATVTDVDSPDFNGGTLTVAFTANGTATDQLTVQHQAFNGGQIGLSGADVHYSGFNIGTLTGGSNGSSLVVTFTSTAATLEAVQALLAHILYSNSSSTPSTEARTLTYTLVDGDGVANGGTRTATATATINVSIPSGAQNDDLATAEDAVLNGANVFAAHGHGLDSGGGGSFSITAVNGSAAAVGNQITLASGARVTLNANGDLIYDPNDAFDQLPGPVSGASNTAATDSFSYTITGGSTATVTVTVAGVDSSADTLNGTAGNDTLDGGTGDDMLSAGLGDDVLEGGPGSDALDGGDGSDTADYSSATTALAVHLESSFAYASGGTDIGTDTLASVENAIGGSGDDYLYGTSGANVLSGRDGSDAIYGGDGDDTIDTGDGTANYVEASYGADTVTGGIGIDVIYGGADNDTLTGGDGNDTLSGDHGADNLFGGAGVDLLYVDSTDAVVSGGADADYLVVNDAVVGVAISASDIENWFGYNNGDTFNASGAGTLIYMRGAGGADLLTGGSSGDWLYGDDGDDTVTGGDGNDVLFGGDGIDSLFGGDATDLLYVDHLDSIYQGGNGSDYLIVQDTVGGTYNIGTVGIEYAYGFSANDIISAVGAATQIELHGGDGDDTLTGGSSVNILLGENGADLLRGGSTTDHFVGGANADTIFEAIGGGTDYFYDYQDGADHINVHDTGVGSFAGLTIDSTYSASNWFGVGYGTGTLWLNTGGVGALDASDFAF